MLSVPPSPESDNWRIRHFIYACTVRIAVKKKHLEEELAQTVTDIDAKLGLVSKVEPRKRTLSDTLQEDAY